MTDQKKVTKCTNTIRHKGNITTDTPDYKKKEKKDNVNSFMPVNFRCKYGQLPETKLTQKGENLNSLQTLKEI